MSLKPIAFAWARPRSTRRSLTHRSRKRSVERATAGVPAGPIFERASRRRRFRISGRLDSSSTGPRRLVMTTASWRQLSPGSRSGSSRTTPRSYFRSWEAGLQSTSRSRRSDAGRRALERIARLIRATSGIERRHFSTIDLPRKPVLPVTRMVLPFRASAITGLSLVSEGSVTQSGYSHDVRTGAVGPTEIRSCGDPEPVALAVLALERRRAVAPRARPRGSSSILRDQVDGEDHGSGAAPPYVDDRGVSLARSRAHGHARQLDRRESWRAPEPEIARVLAPWVRIRAAPAIWVHGAAAVHVIDAEVQV